MMTTTTRVTDQTATYLVWGTVRSGAVTARTAGVDSQKVLAAGSEAYCRRVQRQQGATSIERVTTPVDEREVSLAAGARRRLAQAGLLLRADR